jgi:hypothetical protein
MSKDFKKMRTQEDIEKPEEKEQEREKKKKKC